MAKLRVLDFWTPENHYRWSVSRYGGHVSGSVDPVDRSRLLLCGMVLTNDFLNQHIFKHLVFLFFCRHLFQYSELPLLVLKL